MYTIFYHPLVEDDFRALSKRDQQIIRKAIEKKLVTDPVAFGKPLQGNLKHYFRLRVNDYRIVYSVAQQHITILIIHIGKRKDDQVYAETGKRVGL